MESADVQCTDVRLTGSVLETVDDVRVHCGFSIILVIVIINRTV